MDKPMEIDEIQIDPSPFQLVERTSLHKVGGGRLLTESLLNSCSALVSFPQKQYVES